MNATDTDIKRERWRLLVNLKRLLEIPMVVLGFLWAILIIIDFTKSLSPAGHKATIAIWIIFIFDFVISFIIAPEKKQFLKKNVITILSLAVPIFRVLRVFRIFRLLRGIRLVRILGSINRGMGSLTSTMRKRGFGYILILTTLIIFIGAAGMSAFESKVLPDYWESLWFTSMIVITVGTDHWPRSTEGRILCFFLSLYGFAVLGYLTATIATFFIGRDNEKISE